VKALGIDIGGSGIKYARVDLGRGKLVGRRRRLATPDPATPQAITEAIAQLVRDLNWKGRVGCGFPGRVIDGVVRDPGNLDKSWIGGDAQKMLQERTGCRVTVVNDADAAGLAEMRFGAGHGFDGVAIVLTFGTGIGSSLFSDGTLVPHTHFGALKLKGRRAGMWISKQKRKGRGMGWREWAERVNQFLAELDVLVGPELVIIGGGLSKNADRFLKRLKSRCTLLPAALENDAGIVGAALATRGVRRR
jgi:polyphosphate glucokinase